MTNLHVTVAVEANEEALHILQVAQRMAQKQNADLTVVSVIPPFYSVYADVAYVPTLPDGSTIEESARTERRERLGQFISTACPGAELELPIGSPAHEISRVADKYNSRLIVIGSHNRRGLSRLLGSTTQAVLNESERELLAVRPTDTPTIDYESVVIGVDSSNYSGSVLDAAADYVKDAKWLKVLTVVPPIRYAFGPASASAPECWPFPEAQQDLQKAVCTQVAAMAKAHAYDPRQVEAKSGIPAETLCQLAQAERANLIIVGSNGKGRARRLFLGSTSRRVLNIAPCDVLVTPAVEDG